MRDAISEKHTRLADRWENLDGISSIMGLGTLPFVVDDLGVLGRMNYVFPTLE